jgi:hypothetical protein
VAYLVLSVIICYILNWLYFQFLPYIFILNVVWFNAIFICSYISHPFWLHSTYLCLMLVQYSVSYCKVGSDTALSNFNCVSFPDVYGTLLSGLSKWDICSNILTNQKFHGYNPAENLVKLRNWTLQMFCDLQWHDCHSSFNISNPKISRECETRMTNSIDMKKKSSFHSDISQKFWNMTRSDIDVSMFMSTHHICEEHDFICVKNKLLWD